MVSSCIYMKKKKKININEDKEAILGVILKYYVFFFLIKKIKMRIKN